MKENKWWQNREWLWAKSVMQGKTMTEIAKEVGTSRINILRWLRQLKIPHSQDKRGEQVKIEKDELINLYWTKKLNLKEIANKFGMRVSSLHSKFKKFNIATRDANDWERDEKFKEKLSKSKFKKGWYIERGYKKILISRQKYVLEHQLNWCIAHDMLFIPEGWVVHHKNLNKLDNHPTNLVIMPNDLHSKFHWELEKENGINRFGGDYNVSSSKYP